MRAVRPSTVPVLALLLLALLLLATLPLVAPARAAPGTPEEQALADALTGHDPDAVALLTRANDPDLTWLAGRYALESGDLPTAFPLLAGPADRDLWGRVDVADARGDDAAALKLALPAMDAAMAGAHRDVLATMLTAWAAERAAPAKGGAPDYAHAATFLQAAIAMAATEPARIKAQDALFRLPSPYDDPTSARARLAGAGPISAGQGSGPSRLGAELSWGTALAASSPFVAASLLSDVLRFDPDDAVAAGTALTGLRGQLPEIVISGLLPQLPTTEAGFQLRHDWCTTVLPRDPASGLACLDTLAKAVEAAKPTDGKMLDPKFTAELERQLRVQRATSEPDASARRSLWLGIAEREGRSAAGDEARAQALAALLASATTPALAHAALDTPDGAGNASLRYSALAPADAAHPELRTNSLWDLAAAFPAGAWCGELAGRLLQTGADTATAERYDAACSEASTEGITPPPGTDPEADAALVKAHAQGVTQLRLLPVAGAVQVTASAVTTLAVAEHRVDPEALFRGTSGNPLDTHLDAFLLTPDLSWNVPVDGVRVQRLAPRGHGALAALTVRAGDQRATALVVTDPLDVQVVSQGDDVAIAVLRAGKPVAGAELLIDATGSITKARTGAEGIAHAKVREQGRVMARFGEALGFATFTAGEPETPETAWSIVPWARAVPVEGAMEDVEVYGTAPVGSPLTAGLRLQSVSRDGAILGDVGLTFDRGAAHARLYAQGGGRLELVDGTDAGRGASVDLPVAGRSKALVGVTFSTDRPHPQDKLTARVTRLDGRTDPLAVTVTVTTPIGPTVTETVLGADPVDVPVSLATLLPDEVVSVSVVTAGGTPADASVTVEEVPTPARRVVADAIGKTSAFPASFPDSRPGDSVHLRAFEGQGDLWATIDGPSRAFRLPSAGLWSLELLDGGESSDHTVLAVDDAAAGPGADLRWHGPAGLVATVAEGIRSAAILQPGQALPLAPVAGARTAWLTASSGVTVPLTGADAPAVTVAGTLTRGASANLTLTAEPGSRIWAFVRDATPGGSSEATVAELWDGSGGFGGDAWSPAAVEGVAISTGLLAEEERQKEATDVKRVDFGFDADAEKAKEGTGEGFGMGGLGGRGGGGYGASRDEAVGRQGGERGPYVGDPDAIGVIEGKPPGDYAFTVPGWVGQVSVDVVVEAADGRWTSKTVPVTLSGALSARPTPVISPATDPTGELVAVAESLPLGARVFALAAMDHAGVVGAHLPLLAAQASSPPGGADLALADHVLGTTQSVTAPAPVADTHLVERATDALTLASSDKPGDVERARAGAERLIAEPDLPAFVRVRAALALWVAGAGDEAVAALPNGSGDAMIAAARALVSGSGDARFRADWWRVTRSEAANPSDRALAIAALATGDKGVIQPLGAAAAPATKPAATLPMSVEAPIVRWRGSDFTRGWSAALVQQAAVTSPGGRILPVWAVIPANPLPTRVQCPVGAVTPWIDLAPSLSDSRWAYCRVVAPTAPGPVALDIRWFDAEGTLLARATTEVNVLPAADSAANDVMSDEERLGLGTALAGSTNPTERVSGLDLLEALQRHAELSADVLSAASTTLLNGRARANDPVGLIRAFQSFREHVPDGVLDLPVAAALAHAYAGDWPGRDPKRAFAAVRVVMDARFREELSAVSQLRDAGLDLTALKLLKELVLRYPETPTVSHARFLSAAVLLARADGDGDRLGYTRSSLRHTAVAGLAEYLLLHRSAWHGGPAEDTAAAASTLSDALGALGDDARQRALVGPLAHAFAASSAAWTLGLAQAHASVVAGDPAGALKILAGLHFPDGDAIARGALERGRALEALGRGKEALAALEEAGGAGDGEAAARLQWLQRSEFTLPPLFTQVPGSPTSLPANLRPGTEVTVTAVAIQLDAALLNTGGSLDASGIEVTGLRPTASRTLAVAADGNVPLPDLPDGAYLVSVTIGGDTQTGVLVRSDLRLAVTSSGGTLLHVSDAHGKPIAGAQSWVFDSAGTAYPTHTDGTGAAFVAHSAATVLARLGDRYALQVTVADNTAYPPEEPSPSAPARAQDETDYEQLFKQDANQRVRAEGL